MCILFLFGSLSFFTADCLPGLHNGKMTKEDEVQSKRHNNEPCIGPADACLEAPLKND